MYLKYLEKLEDKIEYIEMQEKPLPSNYLC